MNHPDVDQLIQTRVEAILANVKTGIMWFGDENRIKFLNLLIEGLEKLKGEEND